MPEDTPISGKSLTELLKEADNKIIKLTEERDAWITNTKKLQEGYNALDKKCRDQAALINESVKVHGLAVKKIEQMEENISRLKKDQDVIVNDYQKNLLELSSLRRELATVLSDKKLLQEIADAQKDDLTKERDQWKANHDNQVELKRILMDRPDLKDRSASMRAIITERDALHTVLAETNNRMEQKDRALIEQNKELAALRAELDQEKEFIGNIEIKTVMQELDDMRAERNNFQKRCEISEPEVHALRDVVADLKRQLVTQRAERANLQGYLEVLEPANKTLEGHLSARDHEVANLKAQVGGYAQLAGELISVLHTCKDALEFFEKGGYSGGCTEALALIRAYEKDQ